MANSVIFLDIDGVLNTHRSMIASGNKSMKWDSVGVDMLRVLLSRHDGWKVVMSSVWRFGGNVSHMLASHGINMVHIDESTPRHSDLHRGREIKEWLDTHPEIERYIIIDDEKSEILPEQRPFFVQTCGLNGILIEHFEKIESLMK